MSGRKPHHRWYAEASALHRTLRALPERAWIVVPSRAAITIVQPIALELGRSDLRLVLGSHQVAAGAPSVDLAWPGGMVVARSSA